jgi:hypothetical protein
VNAGTGRKKFLDTEEMLKYKFDVVYVHCGEYLRARTEDKRRWQCRSKRSYLISVYVTGREGRSQP